MDHTETRARIRGALDRMQRPAGEGEVAALLQALDQAGFELVEKSSRAPAQVAARVPAERIAIDGIPGAFIVRVDLPGAGSLARVEIQRKAHVECSPWLALP